MRINRLAALGALSIASALGCAESESPCSGGGTFATDGQTGVQYCVYSVSSPIVIEGGFECPTTMRFDLDTGSHRICSASAFEGGAPPQGLCVELPELCSREPVMPGAGFDAGASEMEPAPSEQPKQGEPLRAPISWAECDRLTTPEEALTGDTCAWEPHGGCGQTTDCTSKFAICDPNGLLKVSDHDILGCEAGSSGAPNSNVPHTALTCTEALDTGATFDACTGSFVCARPAEQACCVEYGACLPEGVFYRYRLCERGCGNVEPNAALELVTDCTPFLWEESIEDMTIADRPCQGDFLCWNGIDLTNGAGTTISDLTSGWLRWCEGGVVRGQQTVIMSRYLTRQY